MPAPRPTLRRLAAEAGVSVTTMSLALRHSPEIAAATRLRLQRLAQTRGYRPDPHLAQLMSRLRTGTPGSRRANVCALGQVWSPAPRRRGNYFDRLLGGLRQRSASLGYAFSFLDLDDYPSPAQLERVLRNRGIEGLFLLPLREPAELAGRLDWSAFSVVTVTSSVTAPRFHAVTPAHFDNLLLASRRLLAAGRRRIGLAMSRPWDLRVQHRWTGAMAWHNAHGGAEPVAPLLYEPADPDFEKRLRAWIARERPDVVLYDGFERQRAGDVVRRLPAQRRPAFVSLNWPAWPGDPGVDQRVERIGAVAAELLAAMIARGEKGVPDEPNTTLVPGRWCDETATG